MAEVRIKDIDEHEIDTILAEDIDFEGHLTFKKPLMIKGKFKGEIKSTSSLYIGEKAYVEATTEAGIISSKGRHKGDIQGHSRVELFSTAQVDGDITTPDFIMESGCKFNGYCNMGGEPSRDEGKPVAAPAQTQAQRKPRRQPLRCRTTRRQPQRPLQIPQADSSSPRGSSRAIRPKDNRGLNRRARRSHRLSRRAREASRDEALGGGRSLSCSASLCMPLFAQDKPDALELYRGGQLR